MNKQRHQPSASLLQNWAGFLGLFVLRFPGPLLLEPATCSLLSVFSPSDVEGVQGQGVMQIGASGLDEGLGTSNNGAKVIISQSAKGTTSTAIGREVCGPSQWPSELKPDWKGKAKVRLRGAGG